MLRADAKYNLARHYASLAEEGASNRDELLKRASTLLEHSLSVYQSQLGQSNEKVKFALQAIASIREAPKQAASQQERVAAVSRPQQTEPSTPLPPAREVVRAPAREEVVRAPAREVVRPPAPRVAAVAPAPMATPRTPVTSPRPTPPAMPAKPAVVAKAPIPAKPAVVASPRAAPVPAPAPAPIPAPVVSARARPSFDCTKARSTPERLICSDDELASQDRELGRIYSRAKREASDPAAFQRVSDREWRRREAECRTRECLLDWYSQRRRQLLGQQ